ncbi:MAG: hypothetical protein K0Q83_3522 [Deltaproteobacteria bacterium]|nr:hypothetical protein [Deltaproteobacteria bacterium]
MICREMICRSTILLASSVYLLLYLIRIVRMTAIAKDLSFLSALSFYYSVSWRLSLPPRLKRKVCWVY